MPMDRRLARIHERPSPQDWGCDELLTLPEAVALLWPSGPLTVKTLRTAARDGDLRLVVLARKHFVTRRALAAMCQPPS